MRILLASPIDEAAAKQLSERHEITRISPAADLASDPGIAWCDVVIIRSGITLSEPAIARAKNLKLVVRAGSGTDNLALPNLRERGIAVVRIPGPGARAVAELTFGLILAVARRIVEADAQVRRGQWRKQELAGPLLEGKTLAIVGAGSIGSTVGGLGTAWGMRSVGCVGHPSVGDRPGAQRSDLARLIRNGIEEASYGDCLAQADVLTVHVPLMGSTRNLVDDHALARLRPGAIVINTARGGVLDEESLHGRIVSGAIAGAGLDVHEREGTGVVPRLAELPNVVLTPHIGAMASDAQRRIGQRVIELISAFETGSLMEVAQQEEVVL